MAIAFDQLRNFVYIYRYNGAFSSNLAGSSVFDYFDDDASVGDYIAFGYAYSAGGYPFHDLSFTVGTALATTSITVVWEYLKSSGWTAIPSVTDNTNAFQNSGANSVTFNVPEDWGAPSQVNGVYGYFVRCRITAVSGITEGGAQHSNTVQAKDWAIEVTGYSAVTPCLAVDIWNADQSGGWNVFNRLGTTLYHCESNLFVGDGSASYLTFKDISVAIESRLCINANAVFDLGVLVDSGEKTTSNGADLRYTKKYANAYDGHYLLGEFNIYGSCIRGDYYNVPFSKVYSSIIENCYTFRPADGNADFDRVSINAPGEGIWGSISASFNDIYLHDCVYGLRVYPTNKIFTMTSLKARDNSYLCRMAGPSGNTDTINLINADVNTWDMFWSNTFTSVINRQYTVDIQLLDANNSGIQGATVTLEDKDSNEIFSLTTDSNGQIVQQTVTSHQYSWASGSAPGVTTDTDYNDFILWVQKTGYQSIKKVFTLGNKVDWVERLQPCRPVFDGLGG